MTRIKIEDLPPVATIPPEELARIFGAGRYRPSFEMLEERQLLSFSTVGHLIQPQGLPTVTKPVFQVAQAPVAGHVIPGNDIGTPEAIHNSLRPFLVQPTVVHNAVRPSLVQPAVQHNPVGDSKHSAR